MALALDLTPQPLSTGASSSRSRTADASVQAHLLPALPSAPHVPLPSLSSPLPTPSSLASPSTPFPSGSAPSAVSAPLAAASRPCPSQPTTSRSEPSLPTPPASATNSWPSTPPPSSAHLTPGLLLCPPVDLTRCSSFSSFATDDSDAMDMSDFDIRELCGGDWQRYPPLKATEPPAQAPSPVPSSFDTHESYSSRASLDEDSLPEHPYVDGFSTYIHPSLRKQSKHTKSSSGGAYPERTSSRRPSHIRRSRSASNFASMFQSDEAPPPVPPLPIHSPTITTQRSPIVPALMMRGPYPVTNPDKALPTDDCAVSPPPLPPKTPDLPKSSSAELVSINEAAAMAVRRRTRSGPQPMPLFTSYHGNLSRSVDTPPRLHTTNKLYASPRQPHRRAHSVQHSIRDSKLIPDFTLPSRSSSRQSLKESISGPAPVLPDKLMPSSYNTPYPTRSAPSPPQQPVRRPIGSHRPAPPPPDLSAVFSSQRPLPPLPDVPASPVAAVSPVSPLPRSITLPVILTPPTVKPVPVKRRISILKNPLKVDASEPTSPGSLAKQQAQAWRKAVHDEAIAALRPPMVPALERSLSISSASVSSPTKSLAELAADWDAAMTESPKRNVSSTFSSDTPLTPDLELEKNPFDTAAAKIVVTESSPRSVGSYGVPF
ncbi:hypothetical protein A1Q1_00308 [Trichosporon asahii var. asahii CBS 2479]|uniref:Uncharacterized protein n=1 Tax=Trichosporon asahii var. asahii (strain ATCC 90039 / CBS 2479 / JCM 2466 / KCTC 7840 / NBRC 103889/ NCYC 2677 / UAMH 7654) TaxID=1186058 RepID=J8TRW8_TRIAS|nr:hypothetical protein A1Q1_00308 [Trichosporon asahii var. asahii CBS 2479]EJT52994.1 hypothetical protein A1Q1_00308 [Trichosporon asahii var. asahii CBS 2479]